MKHNIYRVNFYWEDKEGNKNYWSLDDERFFYAESEKEIRKFYEKSRKRIEKYVNEEINRGFNNQKLCIDIEKIKIKSLESRIKA